MADYLKFNESKEVEVLNDVQVPTRYYNRIKTGVEQLDLMFGGEDMPGIMPGATILLTGFPGAGKSTLALQLADIIEKFSGKSILYNAGEQTKAMIKMVANRLNLKQNFCISRFDDVDKLLEYCEKSGVEVLIQDSLQSLSCDDLEGNKKLLETGKRIVEWAMNECVTVVLVGQITKGGEFAGPMQLKHDVDIHAHLSFNKDTGNRIFELSKNRFGPAAMPYEFFMSRNGMELRMVDNPEEQRKAIRSIEKREKIVGKAKELLLKGEQLSGYSSMEHTELATFIDKECGGCSGGYWRGVLAVAVRELENEGHKISKRNVDRRECVFVEH